MSARHARSDRHVGSGAARVYGVVALTLASLAFRIAAAEPGKTPSRADAPEPLLATAAIVRTSGEVEVSVPDLGRFRAKAPLKLGPGARLTLAAGASVSGLCADLEPFELSGAQSASEPCVTPARPREVAPLAPLRGDVPPEVPRLLWPRSSYLRELDSIEWRPVPDQHEYTILLLDDRATTVWSARAPGSQARYPASAPRLEPGRWYGVRVRAARNDSDEEPVDLGFQLLSAAAGERITRAEARLAALSLPPSIEPWVHGLLLRRFRLHGEALAQFGRATSTPYLLERAETKLAIGLVDDAIAMLVRVQNGAAPGTYEKSRARQLLGRLGVSAKESP